MGRKLADELKAAGVNVIRHDDVFKQNTPDEEWLTRAGMEGWVVFTKDKMIRKRVIERQALIRAKVRAFVFTGGNISGVETAELIVAALPRIQRILNANEPPFIARITGSGDVALIDEDHE